MLMLLAAMAVSAQVAYDEQYDTNRDGKVDIEDVTAVVNYILGIQPEEPVDTHEYVDLGLPSGTLWATTNVGAEKPEDYGLYFAWGETTGYTGDTNDGYLFDWASYKWCNGDYNQLTKYCYDISSGYNGFTDTLTELEPEDDAAYVNWGPDWRMPILVSTG